MSWRPTRRWLVAVVAAVLAIEVIYLIGANGFLKSSWGRELLNRRPETLAIEWESAWTWVPGLVRFRNLELEGKARRAHWRTSVESGRMTIWLPSLARKHFRLLGGRGSGILVEVDTLPASGARPRVRQRKRGWRVTLDHMDLEPVRVLRINEHRLSGSGRISGGARFQVHGPMALDLVAVSYAQARLDTGEEVAADSVRVDGRLEIAPFVVGDEAVGDILAGTTGVLVIDAEASGLGFLGAYLGRLPWLRLGGEGHLSLDLEVTDGWLAPGSRVDLVGPTVHAKYFDLEARGEGTLRGRVPAGAGHTEIDVRFQKFAVTRSEDGVGLLEGEDLGIRIRNDSTAIDRPAEGLTLEIDLPRAGIPDFSAFSPYLPPASGLALTGGQGEFAGNLKYSTVERNGNGFLQLWGDRVEAVYDDVRLRSKVRLDVNLGSMLLDEGVFEVGGSRLSISDTETRQGGKVRDRGWWGRVEVSEGNWARVSGSTGGSGVLEGAVTAELRDTGPLIALLERHVHRLAWFDGLLTVHDVEAKARVRSEGEQFKLSNLMVTGGEKQRLEILAELELEEKRPSGVFFARWGPLTAAVALEEGQRDWKLTGSRGWYEERARLQRERFEGSLLQRPEQASEGS